ncbi:MAG: hypothetical protein R3F44_13195 [Candidatus Competibacteraceae bacterium]
MIDTKTDLQAAKKRRHKTGFQLPSSRAWDMATAIQYSLRLLFEKHDILFLTGRNRSRTAGENRPIHIHDSVWRQWW